MVMVAARTVGVLLRSRYRHEGLSWKENVSWLVLLLEMIGNFRMVRFDIADQPSEKSIGLEILS